METKPVWSKNGFVYLFFVKLATKSSYKGDTPTFVDNKGEYLGTSIMSWMTPTVFIYVYRADTNVKQFVSFFNKHNLHLKNMLCWLS